MAKKKTGFVLILILLLAFGAYWMFLRTPSGGPDLIGDAVGDKCVSRAGTETVMCCLKDVGGVLTPVPCEDTLVTQALVSTGGSDYNIDGICFGLKITNRGNVPLDFKVLSTSTVSTNASGGAGITEIQDAWSEVVNMPKIIDLPVASVSETFSIKCMTNPILLSFGGFNIPNGEYTTTINIEATGPKGETAPTTKIIKMDIKQADLGYSIEVITVGSS